MKKISLLTFGLAASLTAVAQNKPNIVYILTDDLGYGDLKCLNPNSQIPTTNMDRLSKEGVIFTNVHSNSAFSSPTRYGILCGRYAFRSALKTKDTVNIDLICLIDLFSTCVEHTGQTVEPGVGDDSFSMLSAIKGTSTPKTSRTEIIHHSINGMFALRSGKWKFVDGNGSGGWTKEAKPDKFEGQLYDMINDPQEKVHLYATMSYIVKKLRARLNEIRKDDSVEK